ncbi:MAG TPA: Co2+/Mg2+ efflux protein ApaG [Sphingobacteriaceae bacterium]|nr:Co2+/Mg2+ efflux protein ApaG [Sphingobacteriaceae bacterium]
MVIQITEGVKISVESIFQTEYSNPENEHYMFAYHISIENLSNNSIQLLRRYWNIFDSKGSTRELEGEGVVGLQPIIEPGESHEYVSGCNLQSDMGYMEGTYQMVREADGSLFEVEIPRFYLIATYRLN